MKFKAYPRAMAAFALAATLAPLASAHAAVNFTYTGADCINAHDPFTTSEHVTGTVTFATPLAANLCGVDGADAEAENRTLAPFPTFTFNSREGPPKLAVWSGLGAFRSGGIGWSVAG